MASNNFLIFNENKKNMLSDTAYDSDNQRKNGLEPGMARSALMNKVLYQITSVCSSIAQFLASKGYNVEENADSLYNCISDLLSNKIVDDTTSLNEGIYRNLLLDANISDDINNLALGKSTPYNITHGLGYTFIYKFNIINSVYKEVLKVCDSRHDIANNADALRTMSNIDELKIYWRRNLFLTQGKTSVKNETIAQNLPPGITTSYKLKKIPNKKTLFLSSEGKSMCYYSEDGLTWNALKSGRLYFSTDYEYVYIIYNESSDGGETWYCYNINDLTKTVSNGNLTLKYGSVQSSNDFCVWESEGSYYLITQWVGPTVYAWYQVHKLPSPTQITNNDTYKIFGTNIGHDSYINTYKVGKCILAGWSASYTSNAQEGEYYVGFIFIKGDQIKRDERIHVNYNDYGNNTTFKFNVQFSPDSTSNCKLKMQIANGSGEEVRTYWTFNGDTGASEATQPSTFNYPSDWNTRYTYTINTKTKYKYEIDSSGFIINDTMVDGDAFHLPTDFLTRYIRLYDNGINMDDDNYTYMAQFIDNDNCGISKIVFDLTGSKIIKSTVYFNDET